MDVALGLLTMVTLAAVLAVAPVLRRGRRRAPGRGPARRVKSPSPGAVLAVCPQCLEITEAVQEQASCRACGADVVVRPRISDRRPSRRPRTPAGH